MSDITVTFKNETILTMDASGSKDLLTRGKYCEDDITIAYVKPSGGGGAPSNVEIGTFTVASAANQVTVQHSFGHVPKMAFVFNTSAEWPNALICEELMSSPLNGDFDISYATAQRKNTAIGCVYNESTKQYYSSDTHTTYPAAMTSTEIVFATGRYYSIQFKPGYTYFYVIVG